MTYFVDYSDKYEGYWCLRGHTGNKGDDYDDRLEFARFISSKAQDCFAVLNHEHRMTLRKALENESNHTKDAVYARLAILEACTCERDHDEACFGRIKLVEDG